jgi:ubiquinone/menaquinone biosynthesis C-methylase UbiE
MRFRTTTEPDWRAYADAYDVMADNNPAYQDLRRRFIAAVAPLQLRSGGILVEFGAGTGNFSIDLARQHADCNVVHLDSDESMIRAATSKAAIAGLTNMAFMRQNVTQVGFDDGILDFAAAIHCMYTFPDPAGFVADLFRWLRPGGIVFACDPGRLVNVAEWSVYLFRECYQRAGVSGAVSLFWRGRAAFTQNRSIRCAQQRGAYWTHSHATFREAFTSAGFRILESETVYRGCSDLVVCQKP